MIISHAHKFLFVAIPKTATHSIRRALRPQLHQYDWEQCHLFEHKAFPLEPIAQLRHGHISCVQIKPFLPAGIWEQYWKFCFVRNPYDRFVSTCYFFHRETSHMERDPLGTMKRSLSEAETRQHVLFRPQHEFICGPDSQLLVDYVGTFEALQEHFDTICQRLQLPSTVLSVHNASDRKPVEECYDRELRDMVASYYAKDFALWRDASLSPTPKTQ